MRSARGVDVRVSSAGRIGEYSRLRRVSSRSLPGCDGKGFATEPGSSVELKDFLGPSWTGLKSRCASGVQIQRWRNPRPSAALQNSQGSHWSFLDPRPPHPGGFGARSRYFRTISPPLLQIHHYSHRPASEETLRFPTSLSNKCAS